MLIPSGSDNHAIASSFRASHRGRSPVGATRLRRRRGRIWQIPANQDAAPRCRNGQNAVEDAPRGHDDSGHRHQGDHALDDQRLCNPPHLLVLLQQPIDDVAHRIDGRRDRGRNNYQRRLAPIAVRQGDAHKGDECPGCGRQPQGQIVAEVVSLPCVCGLHGAKLEHEKCHHGRGHR